MRTATDKTPATTNRVTLTVGETERHRKASAKRFGQYLKDVVPGTASAANKDLTDWELVEGDSDWEVVDKKGNCAPLAQQPVHADKPATETRRLVDVIETGTHPVAVARVMTPKYLVSIGYLSMTKKEVKEKLLEEVKDMECDIFTPTAWYKYGRKYEGKPQHDVLCRRCAKVQTAMSMDY